MNKILYVECVAAVFLLVVTLMLIEKHRCTDTGLVCVRETWMTAVIGGMLIAMGFYFSYLKITNPAVSGTDKNSYWFIAGYSLLCHLLGCFALTFTFVKRVVLFEDRIEACSAFGKKTTMYWADIVKVDKPVTRKAYVLTDRNGNTVSVSGDNKTCKKFLEFAQTKIKSARGANLLHQVEQRLKGRI